MISTLRAPVVAVLGSVLLAACGTSSGSEPSAGIPPTGSAADGGDGGDGGALSCSPFTPEGYLYRTEAVESFPPCLFDGDEPIYEAVKLGIRVTQPTNPTVQFGGGDGFCKADLDGCRLRAGCGIFVGFDTTGYPALASLDVAFTSTTTFEGTIAFDIPLRKCKETVRVRGRKLL